jgi:hypothetical protein
MEQSEFSKINTISLHFPAQNKDEVYQYVKCENLINNGYWMFDKKFEPKIYSDKRTTSYELADNKPIKLWNEVIAAHKKQMKIEGLSFKNNEIYVTFKSIDGSFKSYFNPYYISLINNLKNNSDLVFWQEDSIKPLLVDNGISQSMMLIMPIIVKDN